MVDPTTLSEGQVAVQLFATLLSDFGLMLLGAGLVLLTRRW